MDDTDALRYERRLHRVFAPDTKPYDGRPVYENLPAYRTPTWLMTGVWMSDASGFAITPQADSDAVAVRPVAPPDADAENAIQVFTGTGSPRTTGYLQTQEGQGVADNLRSKYGFDPQAVYNQALQNQSLYSSPRQVRFGLRVGF